MELKETIEKAEQKKFRLVDLVTFEGLSPSNFKIMMEACDKEIEEANEELKFLEEEVLSKDEFRKHMNDVRSRLEAAIADASTGIITNEFVARYIDKIFVSMTSDDIAKLEIKIFTGKATEKWLNRLEKRHKGRVGHISKKMIESYENQAKGSN